MAEVGLFINIHSMRTRIGPNIHNIILGPRRGLEAITVKRMKPLLLENLNSLRKHAYAVCRHFQGM